MQIGPFTIARTKALPLQPLSPSTNGWFPWGIIRESFTGAWQSNVELRADQVLTNPTLFAVVTRIASDVGKLGLRLVEQVEDDVWERIDSAAFSPVLRRPNRWQHTTEFIEQWMISKLTQGNTYVLLGRDQRRVVRSMYVLDPSRVTPLMTTSGDLYYELKRDYISEITDETIIVPASEIIHDRMVPLFHPLIGVTPIYACGAAADHGNTIARQSTKFFANGSQPGGVLLVPGSISDDTARRLKENFDTKYSGDNYGKIAVLADNMKLEYPERQTAVDSQLIEQMKWSDERICSVYHMPAYIVGVGPHPPYSNAEPLLQAYYSFCVQGHLNKLEKCLEHGLGIDEKVDGKQYGTEFDIDDLIWMDTATRVAAAQAGITGGLSFNEVRKKYYGLGPVKGGESPMSQQQNFSLAALAKRDADDPFAKPAAPEPARESVAATDEEDDEEMAASFAAILHQKSLAAGLYA